MSKLNNQELNYIRFLHIHIGKEYTISSVSFVCIYCNTVVHPETTPVTLKEDGESKSVGTLGALAFRKQYAAVYCAVTNKITIESIPQYYCTIIVCRN